MLTDQEVFDRVATHLLTQRKKAEDQTGMCVYRGPEGAKCALGCLIPDELYEPRFEGADLRVMVAENISQNRELLAYLQDIHDSESVDRWAYYLRHAAETFGLDATILDSLAHPDDENPDDSF
jgi:hypothetical protein